INVLYTKYPLHFDGETAEGFDGVRKAFQQNFLDGWEAEGASLAVYVKGQKVVDLWGGYADKHAARKWKKDTLSVVFSCTKAVAAVCIAVLADRGRLSYDDLVSKHWPGFAKNGKENITIEWVMSHMSGLPYLDTIITEDMATDHHRMRKVLEEEKPKFTPGMSSGYHALTYGWLVDQIVRHTDDKKRSIGQFLREEITGPNDCIPLPNFSFDVDVNSFNLSQDYRVARISLPGTMDLISEMWSSKHVLLRFFHFMTSKTNIAFHSVYSNWSLNGLLPHCLWEMFFGVSLQFTAELSSLNRTFQAEEIFQLVTGQLVSEKMLSFLERPVVNETDYVINAQITKGHGFFYAPIERGKDSRLVHHSGHGCQQITFDIRKQVVIAYVTNALKMGHFDSCRNYWRIHKAVYDIVEKSSN
ncbi:hypothetical protein Angca_008806, partial [Angiostrongylus cantonensis]